MSYPDRWFLGDINVEDPWIFKRGKPVDKDAFKDLTVEVYKNGIALDYSETTLEGIPVISEHFVECLYEHLEEVQLLPLSHLDKKLKYYVLNIRYGIDCIDENNSDFQKFEEGNDV